MAAAPFLVMLKEEVFVTKAKGPAGACKLQSSLLIRLYRSCRTTNRPKTFDIFKHLRGGLGFTSSKRSHLVWSVHVPRKRDRLEFPTSVCFATGRLKVSICSLLLLRALCYVLVGSASRRLFSVLRSWSS